MKQLQNRNQFADLLKERGARDAVEVGVAEAGFSFHLLSNWPGRIFMVDPWALLKAEGFSGHGEDTDAGMEARYQRVVAGAARFNRPGEQPRCVPMRMTSEQAAREFDDNFFDFIFLDGNHLYAEVVKDISWWYPKLKAGGLFAGHDAINGWKGGVNYGVLRAITEFAETHGLVVLKTQEPDYPSWYCVKPA